MPSIVRACCLAYLAFHTSLVFSYGSAGHQAIGALTDRYIADTNAEQEVVALLKKVKLGISLQQAAVWADCAKGVYKAADGTFRYKANPIFAECRPFQTKKGQALMIDFVRRNWDNCQTFKPNEPCHKQYHYTDIAIQRNAYKKGLVGTSDVDLVSATEAAITVLQGGSAPAPFSIKDKSEALLLLAHYMGDLHQPMHVAAVYLDADGQLVDPDKGTFDHTTETRGGNNLKLGTKNLHAIWDSIPKTLDATHMGQTRLRALRKVEKTEGPIESWPTIWASDTLHAGKAAFSGITYSPRPQKNWPITLPEGYTKSRTDIQREELLKSGARFGQLLEAIWP
jgi:hypothetical protein